MSKIKSILCLAAFVGVFGKALADPSPFVIDLKVEKNTGELGAQYLEMVKQLTQEMATAKHLEKEIEALSNFRNPDDIQSLMSQINNDIHQSEKIDYNLNKLGDQFNTNYPGYQTSKEIDKDGSLGGVTYQDFYVANTSRTLSTIHDSTQAIEKDNGESDADVNMAISQAQGDIAIAAGTTQAVSGLAEVNVQILRQLQSMHAQLAAMTEAQNAAAAEKIQNDATSKAEFDEAIANDAAEPVLKYGDNPLPNPVFK